MSLFTPRGPNGVTDAEAILAVYEVACSNSFSGGRECAFCGNQPRLLPGWNMSDRDQERHNRVKAAFARIERAEVDG